MPYYPTHKTASGTVTLAASEWRDGQSPKASLGIARLMVHDDVTNAVWKFTGKKRDAAATIGALYVGMREKVATWNGDYIEVASVPHDFWKGKGEPDEDGNYDEVEPDLAAYPDVVAW